MSAQALRFHALLLAVALSFVASVALAHGPSASAKVNINTASAQQLTTLPGIGPKKAEAIVGYRKANGAFAMVDDLVKVKGIGPKTLDKLRPLITVGKPSR